VIPYHYTIVREAVHVAIGFTATVTVGLSTGTLSDSVTVSGASATGLVAMVVNGTS